MVKIAVLVDGSFYLKRYQYLFGSCRDYRREDAIQAAGVFRHISNDHVHHKKDEFLYRILYYDCPPLEKRVHNPVSRRSVDFEKSPVAKFRRTFFNELKKQRKVALRLGHIKDHAGWVIKPKRTKELLGGRKSLSDLNDDDVYYDVTQKGLKMRIGLDITALAYKRLIDRIVLISGDSDFVSAAKVARREGIDFVLDPMWNHIDDTLFEHIDGLNSVCPDKPRIPATIDEYLRHVPRRGIADTKEADPVNPVESEEDHAQ